MDDVRGDFLGPPAAVITNQNKIKKRLDPLRAKKTFIRLRIIHENLVLGTYLYIFVMQHLPSSLPFIVIWVIKGFSFFLLKTLRMSNACGKASGM